MSEHLKYETQVKIEGDKSLTMDQRRKLAQLIDTFLDEESVHGSVKKIQERPVVKLTPLD